MRQFKFMGWTVKEMIADALTPKFIGRIILIGFAALAIIVWINVIHLIWWVA